MRGPVCLLMMALVLTTLVAPVQAQEDDAVQKILSKDGSPVTFYGHLFATGRGSPMPMNTQYPSGEDDYSRGVFGGCGSLAGVPVGMTGPVGGTDGPCEDWEENESWFYTTAGFVQVKSADEWTGYDQFHNERGQTKDIYFDTSQQTTARFWMSADWHGWSTAFQPYGVGWNWDPGYFQDWVVEATVYHASLGEWSSDPSSRPNVGGIPDMGPEVTKVAYGKTEPRDLVSFDSTIPAPMCEGECRTVHPFDIVLDWDEGFDGRVPYQNDLLVRFQWYQETGEDRYIMTPGYFVALAWNVNAGEDFPPSITFPTRNPLDVELVFPRFVHDKLVVLSIINTPWGSYDIDPELTELVVKDAAGNIIQPSDDAMDFALDSSVAHAGHYKPINMTWVWDYQLDGIGPGDYTVTVEATNFQHSYTTSTTASFSVAADGENTATAGRSGLASYSDSDFEAFKEGAGIGAGTDDQEVEPADEGDPDESQDSPGFAVVAAVAVLGMVLALRRRP